MFNMHIHWLDITFYKYLRNGKLKPFAPKKYLQ